MFELSFMQNAFMAGIIVAILCPFIGLFIVLRRNSMIGDTLSHSSFAGVAIGLVIGTNPIITAFLFTSLCAIIIEFLRDYYKKYSELVMSIVLTLSLGIAIILVSSGKAVAKVDSFLFGSILTVTKSDILLIALIGTVCIILLLIIYNKLIYVTFDESGAKTVGINVKLINYIFTLLVGATISLSIQIMGILVVSSIMVVPVATAMQLKKGFNKTLIFSIIFGLIDVILGLVLSYYLNSAPGGTIALTSVIMLVLTLIFTSNNNR
ncbi:MULTISPECIES: metal ABC transporter permease [unclassified Clostridium]|uniref:Metal ion ABC transporter, permease protein n=1 Tax=Clostridium botulinum (strain Eklund 17B / Type B) TaxID=935198 RepID=B2TLC4_CLOBB|nr:MULTISPECIES: metal ABC transporter permease [unclassified Clostridium]ACD24335.1 putative metal ion ABC transporter, permease protein [Clostridium botulinum B str. Eklund 17B (NRP)]MBN1051104.1 metal ABC transporter permease [Clostridium botulinum]MBY6976641.1 metal ABC transporter permease [Clostridium botulinum]MBY7001426.1 metal ABC transporter permease [Clostridium botulinum]MBZ9690529.1 metal ABC transporter permease [Clostridium sp. M14]